MNIDHLCIVPGKAKAPEAKDKGDKGKAIEATVSVGDRLRMVEKERQSIDNMGMGQYL